ncbi:MAG: hypothetical protein EOQ50_05410 [Mesorhizobium sp.]|uniref:hypothetical protein n=1 Tax=Mesorhizobium sp. TaxID=1871066 RepID=UPI000FE658B1|nr:hypothetical protein [Mesorhizobium sp.]RWB77496.1 MAG: hypothetical protein EOQ50_05410 [Mesorhizobium sp.]
MVEVIPFTRGGKSYRPEFVLFEDRKRRQWAVIESLPDGTENCLSVYRGRKREAQSMANLYTRVEARRLRDRQRLAAHPWGQFILGLSPDDRDLLAGLLNFEKSFREDA